MMARTGIVLDKDWYAEVECTEPMKQRAVAVLYIYNLIWYRVLPVQK